MRVFVLTALIVLAASIAQAGGPVNVVEPRGSVGKTTKETYSEQPTCWNLWSASEPIVGDVDFLGEGCFSTVSFQLSDEGFEAAVSWVDLPQDAGHWEWVHFITFLEIELIIEEPTMFVARLTTEGRTDVVQFRIELVDSSESVQTVLASGNVEGSRLVGPGHYTLSSWGWTGQEFVHEAFSVELVIEWAATVPTRQSSWGAIKAAFD